MTIPYDDYLKDIVTEDCVYITGVEVLVDNNTYAPNRDLVVRAETVHLSGPIKLPGRNVGIFARELICTEGALIDVSGLVGDPDFTSRPRANDGRGPGAAGTKGKDGGDGQAGGQIKVLLGELRGNLSLAANGGNGGGAEDGGNGIRGRHGQHGRRRQANRNDAHPGNGGQGGAGGAAGVPGKGGSGGEVSVVTHIPLNDGQLQISADGGLAGTSGIPGKPGAGGAGGRKGSWFEQTCDGP